MEKKYKINVHFNENGIDLNELLIKLLTKFIANGNWEE